MMRKFLCWLLILALLLSTFGALADGIVILKNKASGTAVKLLQKELKALGYGSGKVDGKYGDSTVEAVENFRIAHGLSDKGYVDNDMVLAVHKEEGSPKLKEGSASLAVYAVQRMLYLSGYLSAAPDGKYGKTTVKAVKNYQKKTKDKMVAFMEEKAAQEAAAALPTAAPVPKADTDMPIVEDEAIEPSVEEQIRLDGVVDSDWLEFMLSGRVAYSKTLQKGNKGAAVKRMQKRLKSLKYLSGHTDGAFGTATVRALKYFQYRNGLEQTGKFDIATQKKFYSESAKRSDQYVSAYKAYVSRSKNKVWIYKWTGKGYDKLAKTFRCTTGARKTPTKKGTFQALGQSGVRWWHMDGCWVQYCFIIDGGYFFHSLLYTHKGAKRPTSGSVANLGKNASHGCVRLELQNAKWIYDHCEPGMTVVIK